MIICSQQIIIMRNIESDTAVIKTIQLTASPSGPAAKD